MKLMDKVVILSALQSKIDFCKTKMSEPDDPSIYGEDIKWLSNKEFWGRELEKLQSAYKVAQDFKYD